MIFSLRDIYLESPNLKKQELKAFYETSDRYLAELNTHGEKYLKNYISLVSKYVRDNFKILDLGCGTGMSTFLISSLREGLLNIGCDISFKFLSGASDFKKDNLAYVIADASNLPFKNEMLDIVTSFQFIEHVSEIENVLYEMIRVLKKDGIVIIMSPNLLSPFSNLRIIVSKFLNRRLNRDNLCQNLYLIVKNTLLIINKIFSSQIRFLFRKPSLNEDDLSPDADSIYLTNHIDIKKFLKRRGFKIINIAKGMSYPGVVIEKIFPYFSGEIGIVAKKENKLL